MKKIMFSDEFMLTQVVLEGRKTQTRRVCKEQVWSHSDLVNAENGIFHFEIPKYEVGEVVAVAQSYKELDALYNAAFNRKHSVHGMTIDMLDCVPDEDIKKWFEFRELFTKKTSWKNKMFVKAELMPHQIRITDVRVERLQDISDVDCIKEGVIEGLCEGKDNQYRVCYYAPNNTHTFFAPREAFANLINKVGKKDVWQENPYVFVYDFELVK